MLNKWHRRWRRQESHSYHYLNLRSEFTRLQIHAATLDHSCRSLPGHHYARSTWEPPARRNIQVEACLLYPPAQREWLGLPFEISVKSIDDIIIHEILMMDWAHGPRGFRKQLLCVARCHAEVLKIRLHYLAAQQQAAYFQRQYADTAKEATTETKNVESEGAADSVDAKESAKASRRAEDWERALKLQQSGALHDVKVEACNNGGLVVRFGSISGFLPFSQIGNGRVSKEGNSMIDVGKDLIGKTLSVKVIEVSKDERRLLVSEKKAVWLQSIQQLKEGDVCEGKVNCVTDFGAFVDLLFPDGSYPLTGLVHVSELSWDKVYNPRDLVQEGQVVQVKVTGVDLDRMRLALSMKQLQGDPLLETLDSLMPQENNSETVNEDEASTEPLPGLADICQELLKEDGIDDVTPGRVAIEKRVVSQDLELWLSSAPVENGNFTLLARAGRQVQEVHVKTALDRDGIKAAVQRVTGRIP
ncbi:hypothetical protein GOP47_0005253 [Adiantum capillus-veneris]|uniref:S1 motif domain-containing protein n=1 Tax=Adiantum capillus-veneris TaxID=13818 RepID=A0A9D4V571_ADICA|nr:hypothetical protein GOP47_0005253 [Adiantum capillus-veneris]